MAENTTQTTPQPTNGHTESMLEHLKNEFLPKHGTKLLVGALVVVAGLIGFHQYQKSMATREAATAELLGKGFDHLYNGRTDSAQAILESAVNGGSVKGLALAKASLLAANIHLQKGEADAAAALYQKALDNASGVDLIAAAALHGKATAAMEKQDYAAATTLLEQFVSTYGKRTGNLEDRYAKTEPADLVTTVPDALWKLSLCYGELKQTDKAKASAEKLVRIYGDSRQAGMAKKFLATL